MPYIEEAAGVPGWSQTSPQDRQLPQQLSLLDTRAEKHGALLVGANTLWLGQSHRLPPTPGPRGEVSAGLSVLLRALLQHLPVGWGGGAATTVWGRDGSPCCCPHVAAVAALRHLFHRL